MKTITYKGALYVEAQGKTTDSLAGWLESRGVEIELHYRKPMWNLTVSGPGNNVTASGKSMNAVLARGCHLFARILGTSP